MHGQPPFFLPCGAGNESSGEHISLTCIVMERVRHQHRRMKVVIRGAISVKVSLGSGVIEN